MHKARLCRACQTVACVASWVPCKASASALKHLSKRITDDSAPHLPEVFRMLLAQHGKGGNIDVAIDKAFKVGINARPSLNARDLSEEDFYIKISTEPAALQKRLFFSAPSVWIVFAVPVREHRL